MNPTSLGDVKSMKMNQSDKMVGLPKVSKLHHHNGGRTDQIMNSHTMMSPVKALPSLADRGFANGNT